MKLTGLGPSLEKLAYVFWRAGIRGQVSGLGCWALLADANPELRAPNVLACQGLQGAGLRHLQVFAAFHTGWLGLE